MKEGYERNPIVFRCINLIANSLASIDLDLKVNGDFIDSHPILDLLNKPNLDQSRTQFFSELTKYLLITGNVFILNPNEEEVPKGKQPVMLYIIKSADIEVIGDHKGATAYEFKNKTKRYERDMLTGRCGIKHIRTFNGSNYFHGMSSINPAAYSIDTFNESLKWNMNLLFNSAKPSAILSTKELQDTYTYEDNFKQIQKEWEGSQNAGSVFLLNNTDYIQTSLSPADMDYRESQLMAARYICNCFGVPPQLVGLPEAQTFNNVESAKVGLYEETILPLLDDILDSLNNWLQIYFPKEEIKLEYDIDKISALESKRKIKMETATGLFDRGLISVNEARDMIGFDKRDEIEADNLYINSGKVPINLIGDVDNYLDDEEFALTENTDEKE